MLGLKISGAGQQVTTVDRKKECSRGLYQVPLLDMEDYIKPIRASGLRIMATLRPEGGSEGPAATSQTWRQGPRESPGKGNMEIWSSCETTWTASRSSSAGGQGRASLWRSWGPWDSTPGRTWGSSTGGTRGRFAAR
jgi:hypothetical protein